MKNIQILTISLLLATLSASLFSAADDRFGKKTFDEKFLSHIKKHSIGLFFAHQLQANQELKVAIRENNLIKAQEAFNKGAKIDKTDPSASHTFVQLAIFYLVAKDQTDMIQLLVENNVDIETKWGGINLLHAATDRNSEEIVKFLLNKNADIDAQTDTGQSALSLAGGSPKIMALLLERKASINVVDLKGNTPLHAVIDMQMITPIDVNGKALIDYATLENTKRAAIKVLLNTGIDLEVKNTRGETAKELTLKRLALGCKNLEPFRSILEEEEQRREDFYTGRGSEYADLQALTSLFGDEADLIEKEVAQEITDYVLPDRIARLLALKKKRDANSASASPSAASAQE